MHWIYVLRSKNCARRYVGNTNNIDARLARHEAGLVFATAPYRPWILIHSESFTTRSEAVRRERWLKTGIGRKFLDALEKELNRQSPP